MNIAYDTSTQFKFLFSMLHQISLFSLSASFLCLIMLRPYENIPLVYNFSEKN